MQHLTVYEAKESYLPFRSILFKILLIKVSYKVPIAFTAILHTM